MRLISAAIAFLLGFAVLAGLGFWQLARLEWKEAILAEMDSRLMAAPEPLPFGPEPAADRFRAIHVDGRVAGPGVAVFGTWRGGGAGYRIVSPFRTDDGRMILVDRGIAAAPEAAARVPDEPLAIEGNLDWPDGPTAPPDGTGVWTSRDVGALAAALGTEPVLVVARSTSDPSEGIRPIPLGTDGIPNNHLGYAIQWFGLALVWAGMAAYWFWGVRRRGEV